jgi:hypothetical protein
MKTSTFSSRLEKIRQVSGVFCVICRVFLALALLLVVGGPLYMLLAHRLPAPPPDAFSIGNQSIGLIILTYWSAGIWMLVRLFGVLASGRIFSPESGRWLKRFGFWIATALIVPIVLRMALDMMVFGALGTIRDAPLAPLVGAFFVGLFLIMLGWVLEEGSELQAEQDLTV